MPAPARPSLTLPYAPRPGQLELAGRAQHVFHAGGQAVLEAGTGTGKTVAALAAALEAAAADGKRVVYLTRTNSQARQVLVEFRALTKDQPDRPLAIALQGRAHLCPELRDDPRFRGASPEEFSRLCGALKRKTRAAVGPAPWGANPKKDPETDGDGDPDADREGPQVHAPRAATPRPGVPAAARAATPRPLPVTRDHGGCPFYAGLLATDPDALAQEFTAEPMDAERFAARLEARGVCPYEAAKGLLSRAGVVVAPYIYLAEPRMARALRDWMEAKPDDCILVVDEAHNLPEYLRALHSPELSIETLKRARSEAVEAGDPAVADGVPASRFIGIVEEALHAVAAERLMPGEEDALVPPDELTVPLLSALHCTSHGLRQVLDAVLNLADAIRDRLHKAGKLPRSYLGSVGAFLSSWMTASPSEHVHVVVGGEDPRLVLWCLDPAIGNAFLVESHAAVHLSGTLRPLDQYRDLLGLDAESDLHSFPSPFPPEHLRIVLVDDVTTRYEDRVREPAMMDRLMEHVLSLTSVPGANVAVFFPSHQLLGEARALGAVPADRRVFVESGAMNQAELMAALDVFRGEGLRTREGGKGAVWLGVMGGRVSEGMDFPGPALEVAALIGVPYPRPTARQRALVRFNEIRFARGWDYAVEAPTVRRVLQAVGRVIRDADDRGIVFLLDARFRKYADYFPRLERLTEGHTVAQELVAWRAANPAARSERGAAAGGPATRAVGPSRAPRRPGSRPSHHFSAAGGSDE